MDFETTTIGASWIWSGIHNCAEILKRGTCYQVGRGSTSNVREDPWIPSLLGYTIPSDIALSPSC